jgi:hypothetical protein
VSKATLAPIIWKIAAGALIPSFATIIFNYLDFFFDNYMFSPMPVTPASVFDIGVGCAFSLVGVCIGSKDHALTNSFLIIFVFLLLLILGGGLIVVLGHWNKLLMVWIVNVICFVALTWAIVEAE